MSQRLNCTCMGPGGLGYGWCSVHAPLIALKELKSLTALSMVDIGTPDSTGIVWFTGLDGDGYVREFAALVPVGSTITGAFALVCEKYAPLWPKDHQNFFAISVLGGFLIGKKHNGSWFDESSRVLVWEWYAGSG